MALFRSRREDRRRGEGRERRPGEPRAPAPGRPVENWREMHDRYGLFLRLLFRRFFLPIRVSPWQEKRLKGLARHGHVVYVMRSASILQYLYLNFTCERLGLPLASFGNGIPLFFLFQPLGRVAQSLLRWIRGQGATRGPRNVPLDLFCEQTLKGGRSLVVFLRRYRSLGRGTRVEARDILHALVACQPRLEKPLYLVPMGILWGKRPQKMRKGIVDILLGDKESPGPFRHMLILLRYARQSVMTTGEVIDIQAFLRANDHLEEDLLAKKIRWSLHREMTLARTRITGPTLKPRRYILESILSSRSLRDLAREISRSDGRPFDVVMKEAAKYADEIAADYDISYIEFLNWLLTWVWHTIYSGFSVDREGLERVREAVRKGAVILMPSHKSHLDYLVLSYVFYHNDLPPPHIAAGVNLSFWPLGRVFRKAGAFFLRRTIKGKRLYAAVFGTYLRNLQREGYVQEFFPEGTRSRTGKLLRPKLGMLSMELDAFAQGIADDLHLVPISITYEKVVEESSYTKELGGGKKRRERLWDLLKTPRFLRQKYGRVYIQFAPPVSVREYLQNKKLDLARAGAGRRLRIAEDLAERVCFHINEVATVTPSALAATVLLLHEKRGIHRSELMKNVSFLLLLLRGRDVRVSLSLQNLQWALDEALESFVGDRILKRWEEPDGPIYVVEEGRRILLDYYKNNVLHFFLPFSLAAAVFRLRGTDRMARSAFLDGMGYLMRVFAHEFLFPPEDAVGAYARIVEEEFVRRRAYLAVDTADRIRVEKPVIVDYFGRMLRNYFEAYLTVVQTIEASVGQGACEEKDVLQRSLSWSDSLYRRGDLSCPESRSTVAFRNVLASLVEARILERSRTKDGVRLGLAPKGGERIRDYRLSLLRLLGAGQAGET